MSGPVTQNPGNSLSSSGQYVVQNNSTANSTKSPVGYAVDEMSGAQKGNFVRPNSQTNGVSVRPNSQTNGVYVRPNSQTDMNAKLGANAGIRPNLASPLPAAARIAAPQQNAAAPAAPATAPIQPKTAPSKPASANGVTMIAGNPDIENKEITIPFSYSHEVSVDNAAKDSYGEIHLDLPEGITKDTPVLVTGLTVNHRVSSNPVPVGVRFSGIPNEVSHSNKDGPLATYHVVLPRAGEPSYQNEQNVHKLTSINHNWDHIRQYSHLKSKQDVKNELELSQLTGRYTVPYTSAVGTVITKNMSKYSANISTSENGHYIVEPDIVESIANSLDEKFISNPAFRNSFGTASLGASIVPLTTAWSVPEYSHAGMSKAERDKEAAIPRYHSVSGTFSFIPLK